MPRYVNPSEFLIKLAIDPSLLINSQNPQAADLLTKDKMIKVCNLYVEKELLDFKKTYKLDENAQKL